MSRLSGSFEPVAGNDWEESAEDYVRLSGEISFYAGLALRLASVVPATAIVLLDFGCGNGRFSRTLLGQGLHKPQTIYLVDTSPAMLALTRDLEEAGSRVVRVQDNEAFARFGTHLQATIDVIACNSSLHLCRDLGLFLTRAHHLLRTGGRIVANLPDQDYDFRDGRFSAFLTAADAVFGPYEQRREARFSEPMLRETARRYGFGCRLIADSYEVTWEEFIQFYSIPFMAARRMPNIASHQERVAHLKAVPPIFSTLEYRWATVSLEKLQ